MVRITHDMCKGGACFNGIDYRPDEDGVIEVPDDAAKVLMERHGYYSAPDKKPKPKLKVAPAVEPVKEVKDNG